MIKIGRIPCRVVDILSLRYAYPHRSSDSYSFLVSPCGIDKISRNATERYYLGGVRNKSGSIVRWKHVLSALCCQVCISPLE